MMTKEKSKTLSGWKVAIAIPVAAGLLLAFSVSVKPGHARENSILTEKLSAVTTVNFDTAKATKKGFEEVRVQPQYPGGDEAMINYMISNVRYPDEAKAKGITGTVYVSFLVSKTGEVKKAKVKKSANPLLDKEAVRVISSMPAWKPGLNEKNEPVDVQYVLPVKFALQKKDK